MIVYPEELMQVKINQLEAEIASWKEIARNENSLT